MAFSVGIHPPKTPITKGSGGVAQNTVPNVCKMPGPPAPFVPTPLPNIARSQLSPKKYSKSVKVERKPVAIRGASFASTGDMASKATGGGLISANAHGPAKFVSPGSPTVSFDGKPVHLKGEPMLNNCAASGMPPNTGATLMGADNPSGAKATCPPHEWRVTSKEEPEQGKETNATEAHRLRTKGGERDIRQAETLEFEIKAIDENMEEMDIQFCHVKIVCDVCGQEGEIDILGKEQVAEVQSMKARNLDTGTSGKKKSKQAKRLNDYQSQMNDTTGASHLPRSKIDSKQIGDEALARRVCDRRGLQAEFLA